MLKTDKKITAYIDGANLHKTTVSNGWIVDYKKFYIFLTEKYKVTEVIIFLGLVENSSHLYTKLIETGYKIVFKETLVEKITGRTKGNCDAELVLRAVSDFYENEFDEAVLVSGDGDFACLVSFLLERGKFSRIFSPSSKSCSYLLKKLSTKIIFLDREVKNTISLDNYKGVKEKPPYAETEHR